MFIYIYICIYCVLFHCTQRRYTQCLSSWCNWYSIVILKLGEHNDEEYHFSLPTVYARSILTVPWVEFGDKVSVTCPQTGYSAVITFLTKVRWLCKSAGVFLFVCKQSTHLFCLWKFIYNLWNVNFVYFATFVCLTMDSIITMKPIIIIMIKPAPISTVCLVTVSHYQHIYEIKTNFPSDEHSTCKYLKSISRKFLNKD